MISETLGRRIVPYANRTDDAVRVSIVDVCWHPGFGHRNRLDEDRDVLPGHDRVRLLRRRRRSDTGQRVVAARVAGPVRRRACVRCTISWRCAMKMDGKWRRSAATDTS